jgi:hypothetical protein
MAFRTAVAFARSSGDSLASNERVDLSLVQLKAQPAQSLPSPLAMPAHPEGRR